MNLLPTIEKEDLKKGLKLRSLILGSFVISVAFLAGLIMLIPSYFLILGNISNTISENYSSKIKDESESKQILSLPGEINSKLQSLQSVGNDVLVTDSLFKIIKYLPAGVKLNSISFEKDQIYNEKKGASILISGVALDRDSLVEFSTLLKESNLFLSADVPVSNLTKDKNLPFSVNIFIKNNK